MARKINSEVTSQTKHSNKVMGAKRVGMQELYEQRALKKARQILNDESHVLAQCYRPF